MTDEKKKSLPQWLKYLLAASAGAGVQGGAEKLSTDSPIHFAVEGTPPVEAPGWNCEPEGGIVGAPVVCRPRTENTPAPVDGRTE